MPRSLTVRLALFFAVLASALLGTVSVGLYNALETQLIIRDDAALVSRVEQVRTLLQDANTMQLVKEKPNLFANMLGNREGMLVLQFPGQAPLIEINPGGLPVPALSPEPAGTPLALSSVRRYMTDGGTPFSAVTASTHTNHGTELHITAGRLMSERTRMLELYRQRIIMLVTCGTILATLIAFALVARGMRPLRSLAEHAASIGVNNLAGRIEYSKAPRELAPLIVSFNAMLDRLEVSFTRLSNVSADMAHDLRTPIGNLLGQTEVALGMIRSTDYYQNLLVSNFEELQRLSRMTDNMLFLARSDHSSAAIEGAVLDVAKEFERVGDYFEGLAEERDLRIVQSGSGHFWADPLLVRRALANLVANAVQYAEHGTEIVLSASEVPNGQTLSVTNSGAEIPIHLHERLFERFYRTDAARRGSAQSCGLGLSIVRTIMALHQGQVSVSSAQGKTTFTLLFPHSPALPPPAQL